MATKRLKWGILGTGRIAHTFATAVADSNCGLLEAVGSRRQDSAQAFAAEHAIGSAYGSYEALLADANVDAVYISLPNHLHAPLAIQAAEAGKHILCEKPLAMNQFEAEAIVETARRCDVFLMEAFMYRCHPQIARVVELIREQVIGQVRHIHANFAYDAGDRPDDIRNVSAMGGGGIMDVGCYCTSAARLIAGAATGQDVAEPVEIHGVAVIPEGSEVDQWAAAVLKFSGDISASLTCGMQLETDWTLRVYGCKGVIEVPHPWFPDAENAEIRIATDDRRDPERIRLTESRSPYTIEADLVATHLADRQGPPPCATWADTLGNMRTLDAWRKEAGVVFPTDTYYGISKTGIFGRPPAPRADAHMKYGRVAGVDKEISRLVIGSMDHICGSAAQMCAAFDYFLEAGGNCIDTAYVYQTEDRVGEWIDGRGVREQVVLIGKGAHPPHDNPGDIAGQLNETLERLKTDYVDIYFLHRDNPQVPVGEFIDALNDELAKGRVRAFGGSNWTHQRLQQANDYASAQGKTGFAASSANLSLAQWNEPMWEACVAVSGEASRKWYQQTQMPLFAWSSQASGFFASDLSPATATDDWWQQETLRVWYNEQNAKRRQRARELAQKKGCSPIQIALAYVLHRPENVFALIGPRRLSEARESVEALTMDLTDAELTHLEA